MKKNQKTTGRKVSIQVSRSAEDMIIPLGDRVLIRPITELEKNGKNSFGIILPDSLAKEKSAEAKVLAVGQGKYVDGTLIPISVKVGDTVVYSKYSYDEVTVLGEELYIIREETILAILKK